MADYKTIHGTLVRSYTTDPDNLIQGQVWYDKTNKVLQFQAAGAGAWSTAANLNTARTQAGAAGNATAALVFTAPATLAIQRLPCLLYAGTCQTLPGKLLKVIL